MSAPGPLLRWLLLLAVSSSASLSAQATRVPLPQARISALGGAAYASATGAGPGAGAVVGGEDAHGEGLHLVRRNIWDRELHEQGPSVLMRLRRQLVDLHGLQFGSPEYEAARFQANCRRVAGYQRVARRLAAGDQLGLLNMGGSVINGTFYVEIYLGTPLQVQRVTFDTGSSILWNNCQCTSCADSSDVITLNRYRPQASSSSQPVACDNSCMTLKQGNYGAFFCAGSSCHFQVKYGDRSTSNGPVVRDMLSVPSTKSDGKYLGGPVYFGCGSNQSGLLLHPKGALDGLLGMGLSPDSVLGQLSSQGVLPNAFSYCMSSNDVSGSHAILGRGPVPKNLLVSNLMQNPAPLQVSYYYVDLKQITVGNNFVQGSDQLASFNPASGSGGVIVDSGTTLTNLPPDVYQSLVSALNAASPSQFNYDDPSQSYPCTYIQDTNVNSAFPDIVMDIGDKQWRVKPSSYLLLLGSEPQRYRYCLGAMAGSVGLPSAIIGESWSTDMFFQIDVTSGTFSWAPLDCTTGDYFLGANAVSKGTDFNSSPGSGSSSGASSPGLGSGPGSNSGAPRQVAARHSLLAPFLGLFSLALIIA